MVIGHNIIGCDKPIIINEFRKFDKDFIFPNINVYDTMRQGENTRWIKLSDLYFNLFKIKLIGAHEAL